jgi:uncharacterized protein (UPF0548 family)
VNLLGLRIGRPTEAELSRLLREAEAAEPTYDHLGSTLDPERYGSGRVRAHDVCVGRGAQDFLAARTALQTWVPQLALGADAAISSSRVAEGETVVIVFAKGPFHLVVPNRIVAVVDEPRRYAFAYGTLPGHPECGEESFTVEHLPDDTVQATIRVEAKAGSPVTRAMEPVVLRLQAAALRRYLRAVADHVRAGTHRRPTEGNET